LLIVA
jgi:hypothetical protein